MLVDAWILRCNRFGKMIRGVFGVLYCLSVLALGGSALENRIVGGYDCSIEENPFIVDLYFNSSLCGGSIINKEWILTAAHCIKIEAILHKKAVAFGGSNSPLFYYRMNNMQVPHRASLIVEAITHPKYKLHEEDGLETRYDIGLVKVFPPFRLDMGASTQPARFGKAANCPGNQATVMGWGNKLAQAAPSAWHSTFPQFFQNVVEPKDSGGIELSPNLQCADVPLFNHEECNAKVPFHYKIDQTVLCSYRSEGGVDSCQGDSGGPLVCENRVVGLVSTGVGCALPSVPAVYTAVWEYRDFIYEHTGRNIWQD